MENSDNDSTDIEDLDHSRLSAITEKVSSPEREIDVNYFLHRSRKSTKLIGNESSDEWITARRDWLGFEFNQHIYVTKITVKCRGYSDHHEMEISYIDSLDGSLIQASNKYTGSSFVFRPQRFIKGFGLNPERLYFSSAQVESISVWGVLQNDFSSVIDILFQTENYRSKIENELNSHLDRARAAAQRAGQLNTTITSLTTQIEDKEAGLEVLQSEITAAESAIRDLKSNLAGTQELIKEANDRKLSTESNLALEEAKLQSLRAEIGKSTKTLKDIKDNINLFPMEIAGFVKQGSQHILQYILLSIIPMAIIVTVMLKLFENSENMLAFFTNNSNISVLEFLISRIPYVAISATIVGVCYSICEVLLTEIVSINRRRQELYKVSIIASDVPRHQWNR